MYGFMDGTLHFQTDQEVKCLSIISNYYVNMTTTLPAQLKASQLTTMSLQISYLLQNVDPLAKACIWSADDATDLYFPWGFGLQDFYRICLNIGYRFGNIYDLISELVNIFSLTLVNGYLNDLEWRYVGGIPGRVLQEVLYPQKY
jgi:hypothetical protein